MQQLTPRELSDWLSDKTRTAPLVLDIREGWEVNLCKIDGCRHIAMQSMPAHLGELDAGAPVVVYCHHGMRSMRVAGYLEQHGFKQVYNLRGGIAAWAHDVARDMPQY